MQINTCLERTAKRIKMDDKIEASKCDLFEVE